MCYRRHLYMIHSNAYPFDDFLAVDNGREVRLHRLKQNYSADNEVERQ